MIEWERERILCRPGMPVAAILSDPTQNSPQWCDFIRDHMGAWVWTSVWKLTEEISLRWKWGKGAHRGGVQGQRLGTIGVCEQVLIPGWSVHTLKRCQERLDVGSRVDIITHQSDKQVRESLYGCLAFKNRLAWMVCHKYLN